MNKVLKRLIAVIVAGSLTCGGVYGGLIVYRTTNRVPVNVYSVGEIAQNTYYYFEDEQSYGTISSDRIQSCFLSSTQNVKQVMVTQGQTVKKGDPLYTFDTTLTEIQLARAENDLAQQQLNLKHAEDDLAIINRLSPSSEDSGEGDFGETEEPESTPEEVEEYYEPEETNRLLSGDGSHSDPYVFLWSLDDILSAEEMIYLFHGGVMPDTAKTDEEDTETPAGDEGIPAEDTEATEEDAITPDGIPADEEDDPGFVETAFRMAVNPFVATVWADEIIPEGTFLNESWTEIAEDNENDEVYFEEDNDDVWIGDETDDADDVFIEDEPEEGSAVPGEEPQEETWTDTEPQEEQNDVITEETEAGQGTDDEINSAPVLPEQEEDAGLIEDEETDAALPLISVEDPGDDMDVFVILEVHNFDNSEAPVSFRYGLHMFRVNGRISVRLYNPDSTENSAEGSETTYGEIDEGGDEGYSDGGYDDYYEGSEWTEEETKPTLGKTVIDVNASYTAKEISDMRDEKQKEIRDLTISVKKAEISLREMKREMSDGTVRSKLDGVVKTVRDPDDAYKTSSAVVQVSGGGGYYVSLSVSELDLNKLESGKEVTVTSFDTGEEMTGKIDDISEYPSSGFDFWSSGNPNSSYYPCKIYLGEDVELRDDDFVGVKLQESGDVSEGFFIETMFVRSASSGHYVYVRGEDGKLKKKNVQVGIVSSDATQIRSGITRSDYVAFPYGNDCVEGANTEEATYDQLYGYI